MEPVQTLVRRSANIFQRVSAFAILAGAFVCLLYFLAYFALNSAFTTQAFDAVVNTEMRGKISWRRLSWGPRPSQLNILEPILVGATGQSVIQAKSITIDHLDILGLLDGRLSAKGVHIDSPVVRIVSHPRAEDSHEIGAKNKVLNISEMFWPHHRKVSDGTDNDMDIDISDVRVRNAMFVLDLPNTSVVSHGIQIPDATFRSYSKGNDSFVAIEAAQVQIRSGQLRMARETSMRRPLKGQVDDYRSWSFERLIVRDFESLGDQISVTKLQALLEKDPFYLTAIKLNSDRPDTPYLSCKIRLETPKIQRHVAQFVQVPITGEVTLTGELFGEMDTLSYKADIVGRDMVISGMPVPSLEGSVRQSGVGRLVIDSLRLGLSEGQVQAQGELTFDEGVGTLDIFPHAIPISSLPIKLSPEGTAVLSGELFGRVSASFSHLFEDIPEYAFNSQLILRDTRARPYGLGKELALSSFMTTRDDTLNLETVVVTSGANKLSLRGLFDLDTFIMDLNGRASVSQISPLMRFLKYPLAGSARVQFSTKGFLARPRVRANLQARRIKRMDLPTADIDGQVVYDNGALDFDRLTIKSETGSIGLKGRIGLTRPGQPIDLRINARQFELASLPFKEQISGRAALDIHLTGKMRKPKVSGRGRIGRPCWKTKYGQKPLCFRRIEVKGNWMGDAFRIGSLRIRDNRNTLVDLSGQGSVSKRSFTGDLKLKGLPAALVNHFVPEPLPIRGSLSAQLKLAGRLKAPSGSGKIQIHGGGFKEYELGQAEFEITADKRRARLTGRFLDSFTLRADIPLIKSLGPGTAIVDFHHLSVEKHLPQLVDTPIKSAASGRLEAQFNLFEGKLIDATASLNQLQAKYTVNSDVSYILELRDKFVLKWDEGTLNTKRLDARFKIHQREDFPDSRKPVESFIVLSGGTTKDGHIDLSLRGTLDFSLAEPALKTAFTQAVGHGNIEGTLRGPITSPTPNMTLTLQSGEFVPRVGIVGAQLDLVEPVVLEIRPRNDVETPHAGDLEITLAETRGIQNEANRMRVLRDDSMITVDDIQIDFEEYRLDRIRVGMSGNELALNIPRVMRGTFDAPRLTFESWTETFDDRRAERRMKVSGEIEVIQGEYMADVTGAAELNQGFRDRLSGRTQTRTVSLFERTPSLKRLMLDLKVSGEGGFYVRNQVLTLTTNLEIRLNLDRIKGFLYPLPGDTPEERLTIDGDISILPDSTITYARREFDVTNGLVSFGGRDFLDAQIEANRTFTLRTGQGTSTATTSFDTGTSDIRQEEVVLSAQLSFPTRESPPAFSFDLSSNSGASKFEVVMLVLTGSYPENLSGAASAQPATEVVLAPLLNLVERPLEDTFKVDLTLTPVSTGTLHIDANKVLSRRLYLYSRVLVGEEQDGNPQQFGLRYQINNVAFGELSNERTGSNVSTTGRLKLRVNLN